MAPLRVLLDVNVWIANLIAADKGRHDTAVRKLVSMIVSGEWGAGKRPAQLVVSVEMLETIELVLRRRGASGRKAAAYANAISDIMKFGPEALDPYLLIGGREQFAMADREDAAILATAFASRADLLVTDNLSDFETRECDAVDTRTIEAATNRRQLYALKHRRGAIDVIVAHPFDVMDWLRLGYDFTPSTLWRTIGEPSRQMGDD
jgi:predicted nucleic acid-binding protein